MAGFHAWPVGAETMGGPIPKPAATRQRRNRSATAATLPSEAESAANEVPELPEREGGWHPMVLAWWQDVWRSPMASEYLEADRRGLYRLAVLEHDFWCAASPTARLAISTEIRHVGQAFGLSPIDRRRLQWQVEQGEAAAERTTTRRGRKVPDPKAEDPRDALRLA